MFLYIFPSLQKPPEIGKYLYERKCFPSPVKRKEKQEEERIDGGFKSIDASTSKMVPR